MGLFDKISEGIRKTRDSMLEKVNSLINSFTKIDEDFFEELEETLIMCDIGVQTSCDICDCLRDAVKERGITDPGEIKGLLKEIITDMLGEDKQLEYPTTPTVILVIGVNGVGKTTTIGKLAARLTAQGKSVIVAAADTFRAAAVDQLKIWAERAGADVICHDEGSDPGSVVFDAIAAAKSRNTDVVICDTAGRLHNKKNLMDELAKINRICTRQADGCHIETLLVLDASTGQNAVNQAKIFSEAANITGIVLTKLDGTAKGGIIITIHRELGIPVKLVGVGEKLDDLMDFSARDYAEALFAEDNDFAENYVPLTDEYENDGETVTDTCEEEIIPEAEDETENEIPETSPADTDITEVQSGDVDENEDITDSDDVGDFTDSTEKKKDLKDGKFGFLFKEITFGKKKKDEEDGE